MTKTKFSNFILGYLIATGMAWFASFVFMQVIWTMAPIPSPTFPAVDIYWPVSVYMGSGSASGALWITRTINVSQAAQWIGGAFAVSAILSVVEHLCSVPFSVMGLTVGALGTVPPNMTALIGGIFGLIVQKFLGKEFWQKNRAVICAGILMGEGLILTISASIAMIQKAMWVLPF